MHRKDRVSIFDIKKGKRDLPYSLAVAPFVDHAAGFRLRVEIERGVGERRDKNSKQI